jgi:hypothetical protein
MRVPGWRFPTKALISGVTFKNGNSDDIVYICISLSVKSVNYYFLPPGAKTFGLTRFTVTPKDFAPTRCWRDQSGATVLRIAGG